MLHTFEKVNGIIGNEITRNSINNCCKIKELTNDSDEIGLLQKKKVSDAIAIKNQKIPPTKKPTPPIVLIVSSNKEE
jgi:hypothetical protein